jgi:hypothetical protein
MGVLMAGCMRSSSQDIFLLAGWMRSSSHFLVGFLMDIRLVFQAGPTSAAASMPDLILSYNIIFKRYNFA